MEAELTPLCSLPTRDPSGGGRTVSAIHPLLSVSLFHHDGGQALLATEHADSGTGEGWRILPSHPARVPIQVWMHAVP